MLNLCALISGGKDSIYSLILTLLSGKKVSCLATLLPTEDSMLFHHPFANKVELIAKSLDIPLITKISKCNSEHDELNELKELLLLAKKKYHINGIITGAIASDYQRMRFNFVAELLNLRVFSPLWRKNFMNLLREESQWLDFVIVKISSEGLSKSLLGKVIKENEIKNIVKNKLINPVFEGGEAETFVLNAPLFKRKILLQNPSIRSINDYEHILIADMKLE